MEDIKTKENCYFFQKPYLDNLDQGTTLGSPKTSVSAKEVGSNQSYLRSNVGVFCALSYPLLSDTYFVHPPISILPLHQLKERGRKRTV
jgi:hypothetical protein